MDYSNTSPKVETTDTLMTNAPHLVDHDQVDTEAIADKISAYYSLAFPNYTYYLQTLTVTIGRRSVRPDTASSSDSPQVDVDLGPLKSVSRLHAKIEYEENQERFVLVVLGRNGAWVDGVWSGAGSRVPLSARSTIQIATRTFQFILPPPPAPEDSPTPTSPSSTTRHLSPSIDITSLSPASSLPSPPPPKAELPPVATPDTSQVQPVEAEPSTKTNGKKRKKPGADVPLPVPEVMPPRPQFTYAQLCYRAIKDLGGKATLQEICGWISDNYEWYRYNESCGWPSSVRHNLSSNRAFKKLERCAGERGKGFFWSNDPRFEHQFEDQEGRGSANATGGAKDPSKAKGKGSKVLEPPLKRSVKGDPKTPLPPPLTSTPLPAFSSSLSNQNPSTQRQATTVAQSPLSEAKPSPSVKEEPMTVLESSSAQMNMTSSPSRKHEDPNTASFQAATSAANAQMPTIPSDMNMRVPIVIGSTSPSSAPSDPLSGKASTFDLSSPPISLQRDTIILNPAIFSSLTPEQLKELESLGAKKAIEILQSYIVRFLKERIKTEGAKAKGKKKKDKKKKDTFNKEEGAGNADQPNSTVAQPGSASMKSKAKADASSTPFTTAPLPLRKSIQPKSGTGTANAIGVAHSSTSPGLSQAMNPLRISSPPMSSLNDSQNEEIDIMGDFDEPPAKKQRLDMVEVLGTAS